MAEETNKQYISKIMIVDDFIGQIQSDELIPAEMELVAELDAEYAASLND